MLSIKLIKGGKENSSEGTNNIWARLYFFQIVINSALILNLVYGFCADVHYYSGKLIARMNQNSQGVRQHRIYTKTIKSLAIVRVDFGDNNFIEKITPVMFQHFSALRIIDSILVT